MALSDLHSWNTHMAASSSCGSACGAGDDKPEQKPAACGSACGSGDK